MLEGDQYCGTDLVLAIGSSNHAKLKASNQHHRKPIVRLDIVDIFDFRRKDEVHALSNSMANKRSSRSKSFEDVEVINIGASQDNMCDDDESKLFGGITRKKLKLSKEQVTLLEDRFREHNTLNMAQKQQIADRLNIQPRQVEVWFQNRRARSKLRQTEVEYEFLKRCCENLSAENRRLKKELQEMKAMETFHCPAFVEGRSSKASASLSSLSTMCTCCERKLISCSQEY